MPTFPRGAKPTPRHKLAASVPFVPMRPLLVPAQFAVVPKTLSYWLNNQYGDCVTAEEAFAKAAWSVQNGLTELFVPDSEVQRWASSGGFLDGAVLTDVMDAMVKAGFQVNGQTYDDGPYNSVDYSNEAVLQAALATGPVKIGIDSTALPSSAGNEMGWFAVGGSPGQYQNEDHCVGLCGYGPAGWLYQQLGVPLPPSVVATQTGYLLFTWSTIGFVDHAWIMSTCGEAWLRQPTTPGQGPAPAPPVPPTPVPPTPVPPTPAQFPVYTGTLVLTPQGVAPPTPGAIDWAAVLALVLQFGARVLPVVAADVAAGKSLAQILADVFAAFATAKRPCG
jgi:hypothetical protein